MSDVEKSHFKTNLGMMFFKNINSYVFVGETTLIK